MKFTNLEDLINYIYYDIMKEDYERVLRISFDKDAILMFVFEQEIPIIIRKCRVIVGDKTEDRIFSEVYAELLNSDIGKGWLKTLDEICEVLDKNWYIFDKMMKGEIKND